MSWYRVEGGLPQHEKYAPLSDAAFRLAITAGCWCADKMTDGRIPKAMVPALTRAPSGKRLTECVSALLSAVIWEELDSETYLVHDYLDWNMSRDQWLAKAAAGAAGGRAKAANRASKALARARCELEQTHGTCSSKTLADSDSDSDSDLSGNSIQRPDRSDPAEPDEMPAAPREIPRHAANFERSMRGPNQSDGRALALFEAYREASGKSGVKFDPKARELFEQLVDDGVSPEEVRVVCRGAKLDDWATGTARLTASAILGSSAQRQRFSELASDPPRAKGVRTPRQPDGGDFGAKFLAAAANGGGK